MPPPSTRSSSSTPVGTARADSTSTSPIGRAALLTGPALVVRTAGAVVSATVPQAWHSPHRPTHLAVSQPHSAHRKVSRSRTAAFIGAPASS